MVRRHRHIMEPKRRIDWVPWAIAFVICAGTYGGFVAAAHAGVDNPLKYDGVHVIHRCPQVTNPIECRSRERGRDSKPIRAIPNRSGHHIPGVSRCTLDRDLYEYHHGLTGKPRALRGYVGCRLYAIDAAYHRATGHLGFSDSLQEASERMLARLGANVSDLGHIALTSSPQ
jgi:hypothetical protein